MDQKKTKCQICWDCYVNNNKYSGNGSIIYLTDSEIKGWDNYIKYDHNSGIDWGTDIDCINKTKIIHRVKYL